MDNEQLDENKGITLGDIVKLVRKNFFALVISLMLGAIAGLSIATFAIPKKYSSTSRLYIVSKETIVNFQDLQIGAALTNDYVEIVKSRDIIETAAKAVAKNSGHEDFYTGNSYETLKSIISVNNPTNTHILTISVTTTDYEEAMLFANELAEVVKDKVPDIMGAVTPNIFEHGVVSIKPVSPSRTKYTLIGGIAGLGLCAIIVFIIYITNQRFRTEVDILNVLGYDTLGSISDSEKYINDNSSRMKKFFRRLAHNK